MYDWSLYISEYRPIEWYRQCEQYIWSNLSLMCNYIHIICMRTINCCRKTSVYSIYMVHSDTRASVITRGSHVLVGPTTFPHRAQSNAVLVHWPGQQLMQGLVTFKSQFIILKNTILTHIKFPNYNIISYLLWILLSIHNTFKF